MKKLLSGYQKAISLDSEDASASLGMGGMFMSKANTMKLFSAYQMAMRLGLIGRKCL